VAFAQLLAALSLRLTAGTVGTRPKLLALDLLAPGPTDHKRSCIAHNSLLQFAPLCRVGRQRLRTVVKYEPRNLTCMCVIGLTKHSGVVKAKSYLPLKGLRASRSPGIFNQHRIVGNTQSIDVEDQKMEVRIDSDVQIDHRSWV